MLGRELLVHRVLVKKVAQILNSGNVPGIDGAINGLTARVFFACVLDVPLSDQFVSRGGPQQQ